MTQLTDHLKSVLENCGIVENKIIFIRNNKDKKIGDLSNNPPCCIMCCIDDTSNRSDTEGQRPRQIVTDGDGTWNRTLYAINKLFRMITIEITIIADVRPKIEGADNPNCLDKIIDSFYEHIEDTEINIEINSDTTTNYKYPCLYQDFNVTYVNDIEADRYIGIGIINMPFQIELFTIEQRF